MIRRPAAVLFAAMLLLTFGTACFTTIQELPKQQVDAQSDSPEQTYCRELIICFLRGDSDGFIKRLTPETQKKFDKKYFENTRKAITETMGQPVSFEFVTLLDYPALKPYVWKVRFERTNREGKKVNSEALFRIITGRAKNNEILVLGFQFL